MQTVARNGVTKGTENYSSNASFKYYDTDTINTTALITNAELNANVQTVARNGVTKGTDNYSAAAQYKFLPTDSVLQNITITNAALNDNVQTVATTCVNNFRTNSIGFGITMSAASWNFVGSTFSWIIGNATIRTDPGSSTVSNPGNSIKALFTRPNYGTGFFHITCQMKFTSDLATLFSMTLGIVNMCGPLTLLQKPGLLSSFDFQPVNSQGNNFKLSCYVKVVFSQPIGAACNMEFKFTNNTANNYPGAICQELKFSVIELPQTLNF